MATLHFELVSPERVLFSGDVDHVVLPALEGEITVLAAHAPTMTSLGTGFLTLSIGGRETRILLRGGFADINAKGLTVLAERAFREEELTKEVFVKEIEIAQVEIDRATEDSRPALELALIQLQEVQVKYV